MNVRQRGFGLIELMISLVIGLAVLAALSEVFVAGQSSYSLQDRLGALQENGRYALYFLQRDLRNAGMPMHDPNVAAIDAANTLDGGGSNSDQISIRYRMLVAGTNCLGNNVNAGEVVATTYSINVDAGTGVSRLMCSATNGGAAGANAPGAFAPAQPIVDGIENLQLLFGIDADVNPNAAGYRYADFYIPANAVTAAQWAQRVVSVRISILASTLTPIVGDKDAENTTTYVLLNAPPVGPLTKNFPFPGGPLKPVRGRVFTSTVEIRNRTF